MEIFAAVAIQRSSMQIRYIYSPPHVCVVDPLMNIQLTYFWLTKYNETYMQNIEKWVQGEKTAPNYFVLGNIL